MNSLNRSHTNQLEDKNFEMQVIVAAPVQKVFKSITEDIPKWWTTMFEGKSKSNGDVFTVRFGSHVFKTMRVGSVIQNSSIVWTVIDTIIDIPELKNKKEWLNTTIEWHLSTKSSNTRLMLKHIGLHPQQECYQICESGWKSFVSSLIKYNQTGTGTPFEET